MTDLMRDCTRIASRFENHSTGVAQTVYVRNGLNKIAFQPTRIRGVCSKLSRFRPITVTQFYVNPCVIRNGVDTDNTERNANLSIYVIDSGEYRLCLCRCLCRVSFGGADDIDIYIHDGWFHHAYLHHRFVLLHSENLRRKGKGERHVSGNISAYRDRPTARALREGDAGRRIRAPDKVFIRDGCGPYADPVVRRIPDSDTARVDIYGGGCRRCQDCDIHQKVADSFHGTSLTASS